MTEITFDFTGLFDALIIFLQTLFGALGDLFAQLSGFFNGIVVVSG
jgi:hypothetical protein